MISADQHASAATRVGDVVAVGITVAALMEWLPAVATILSIIWIMLQITRFCLDWRRDFKRRRGERRRKGDKQCKVDFDI